MAIMDHKWSALPVPHAMELPDRVPSARYFDPDFYAMEVDQLWPRVWQMACRLEEIPEARDFVEYEFLDQSVVVVRTEDLGVTAFQNACRHRGVKVVEGSGTCARGFRCPFHGWCYGPDGTNTAVTQRRTFAEHNLVEEDLDLTPVRCEVWGGCAWINLDPDAPPLRECLEPAASNLDAWKVESLRIDKWYACRLPVNWKLAIEAFVEMYHVVQTHPQLVIPARFGLRKDAPFDPQAFIDADIQYLRAMSDGMDGMCHADDVRIAESLRDTELPADAVLAQATWNRTLNDAVARWHEDAGHDVPDLNELDAQGINLTFFHVFPHYFVLPMYSSASAYRFRPLGPEETLMEIWSLARFAEGEEPPRPVPPEVWEADDPRWPAIPAQDFSNLPRQQRGLHAKGFEYMRLSQGLEGHISNVQRIIDGFLAGLPQERLLPTLASVNVYPFEQPMLDLDLR
jgi:phenylpropionate dioxygenase-like ring-hydroxylating dioxygenase large terminal subunit